MGIFRVYTSFLQFYMQNEYIIQLFLTGLFALTWKRRRNLFGVRFAFASLAYFAFGIFIYAVLPWYYLYMFIFYWAVVWICFDLDFIESIFIVGMIYCVQFVISSVSYAFSYTAFILGADFITHVLISYLVLAVICVPLYFLYFRRLAKAEKLKINSVLVLTAVVLFLFVAVIFSHYIPNELPFEKPVVHIFLKLFSAVFGVTVFMVHIMNNKNTELNADRQILQLLLQKDKEEYERARLNEEQINIKLHDLKKAARLGVLDSKEVEDMSIYRYYTGNRALDTILAAEARSCEKNNIRFICTADGELFDQIGIRSYHIYSLMSNLLDNSIENVISIEDETKREIRVSISKRKGMALISVVNYIVNIPVIKDGLPLTTKKDRENHGFGSKSIRHIAELYGGFAAFMVEDNLFTAIVTFPIPGIDKQFKDDNRQKKP